MFTGIITALGTIRAINPIGGGRDMRLVIEVPPDFLAGTDKASTPVGAGTPIGASIACSGCCLTVVELGPDWFAVDASAETLGRTTMGRWKPGSGINLERSLKIGDELGGHIVSGHVDGVGEVVSA